MFYQNLFIYEATLQIGRKSLVFITNIFFCICNFLYFYFSKVNRKSRELLFWAFLFEGEKKVKMGQVGGVAFRFKCKNTDVEQTLLVINLNNYSIWFRFSCFIAKRVHVLINIKKGKIFTLLLLLNLLFTNAFQWNKKKIYRWLLERSETKILLWESSEGLHSSLVCKKEHLKHKNWSVGTAETEREKIVLLIH